MTTPSTVAPNGASDSIGFEDFAALKSAHARLTLRERAGEGSAPEFLDDVERFLIRAQDTGRVIGSEDERTSVQGMLDYWMTVLMREHREPPLVVCGGLAEYAAPVGKGSLRDQDVGEYLAGERSAIRQRLRLSAAAAQWNENAREASLVWRGSELDEAADYRDLTEIERDFLTAGRAERRRVRHLRRLVWTLFGIGLFIIGVLVIFSFKLKAEKAEAARKQEQAARRHEQHESAKTLVERGAATLRDGDVAAALLWFNGALEKDRKAEEPDDAHRLRLGAALEQMPRLEHVWAEPDQKFKFTRAQLSADGRRVLTVANADGTTGMVRLWNAFTGKLLGELAETGGMRVNYAAYSANGLVIAALGRSSSGLGAARLWDAQGKALPLLEDIKKPVLLAAFSPSGDRVALVIQGDGGKVSIEIRSTSKPGGSDPKFTWDGSIRQIAFSPANLFLPGKEGLYLVAGGALAGEGIIQVWNTQDGKPVSRTGGVSKQDLPVTTVAFSPDAKLIATGSGDPDRGAGEVQVWETDSGQRRFSAVQKGPVATVEFSPDGQRVLSASDEAARLWDARTGTPGPVLRHESSVNHAIFSPDGRTIVTASRDQTARLWHATTGAPLLPPLHHSATVSSPGFSADGQRLLTCTLDAARLWSLSTTARQVPVLKLKSPVSFAALSSDGVSVAAVSQAGELGAGKVSDGAWEFATAVRADGAFFSPDAQRALLLMEGRGEIWATRPANKLATLDPAPGSSVGCAVFSRDGKSLLVSDNKRAADKGITRIYNAATGKERSTLAVLGGVSYAHFSADGATVLTAGGSQRQRKGAAQVWHVADGKPALPPLLHDEEVCHAAFNSERDRVITASVDDTAMIWKVSVGATGQEGSSPGTPIVLKEHTADLTHVCFSPDGLLVATASYDRTAVIWAADSGEQRWILPHPATVQWVEFDPSGHYLATIAADRVVRVWEVASGGIVTLFRPIGEQVRAVFTSAQELRTLSIYDPAATIGAESDSSGALQRSAVKTEIWRLVPVGEKAELLSMARLLSGRKIDERNRTLRRLSAEERSRDWQAVENRAPGDSVAEVTTPDSDFFAVESEAAGQWFAARWHLDRLLAAQPNAPKLLTRRAFALRQLGLSDAAIRDYEAALKSDPKNLDALTNLAFIHSDRASEIGPKWTKALDAVNAAIAAGARDDKLYIFRGADHAFFERWDEATIELRAAIDANPDSVPAFYRLAMLSLKQGRNDEYQELCETMLKRFNADSLSSTIAWACALGPRAVKNLDLPVELALRAKPGNDPYIKLNTLGAALCRKGDFVKAIETLDKSRAAYADSIDPSRLKDRATIGRPVDWIFLTLAYAGKGDLARAGECYKRIETVDLRALRDPRSIWSNLAVVILHKEAAAAAQVTTPH